MNHVTFLRSIIEVGPKRRKKNLIDSELNGCFGHLFCSYHFLMCQMASENNFNTEKGWEMSRKYGAAKYDLFPPIFRVTKQKQFGEICSFFSVD